MAAAATSEVSEAPLLVSAESRDDGRDWGPAFEPDTEEPTYDEMLDSIYAQLYAANPALAGTRVRTKVKSPKVDRIGTTRTGWSNYAACCESIKREQDHVMSFFLAELSTTGSIDAAKTFIMKGRFGTKQIEGIFQKYIDEYVQCHTCKFLETSMSRDAASRLHFITCGSCKSQRSLAPIKAGFHATTKKDRKEAQERA